MFENFAFNEKADSDTSPDDDDPPPSPKSELRQRSSPTMASSARPQHGSDGDRIDSLVRKMSKQTLVREPALALSLDEQNHETDLGQSSGRPPIQIQVQAPPPTSEFDVGLSPNQPAHPIVDNLLAQLRPQHYRDRMRNRFDGFIDSPSSSSKATDEDESQLQIEPRRNSNFSKPQALDLMSNMIENGVQCNVHASTPTTPLSATRPPSSVDFAPPPILDRSDNSTILEEDTGMKLEVDMDYCAQEEQEEQPPPEILALRNASGPAGIRKFGYLKYRSTLEAAARCKNMRKSVPRMRRRTKTQRSDSAVPSETSSTTSTAI
ncbi:hypothetical protein F5Y04DRAFT_74547 [Hypomontagnella monticulosa]|nr:hypothetical protein F5Y04DRAFT_74547 [Hypomontagnella monticulosa]